MLILRENAMPDDLNLKMSQRACVLSVGVLSIWIGVMFWWEPAVLALISVSFLLAACVDRVEDPG